MKSTIDKSRILKAIEELPEDATIKQTMYKLYVLDQVSKALSDTGKKSRMRISKKSSWTIEVYCLESYGKKILSP